MDQIKFMAKKQNSSKWIFFDLIEECTTESGKPAEFLQYLLDKNTIRQFTGYLDIHGEEIYKGHILTMNSYPFIDEGKQNYVGIVEWIFGGWQIVLKCVNPDKRGISDGMNDWLDENDELINTHYEIIGDIYENNDILNGK